MLKPWTLAAVGLAALAALIWYAGPLVAVGGQALLATPAARLLVIAVLTLQYIAQKVWQSRRARRANEQLISALASASDPGVPAETEQLRERFASALTDLKRMRFGPRGGSFSSWSWKFSRSWLYELPWYVIIGAPGAGKTTALLNSGLGFPLGDKRGAVHGVGGTRNCDWWFTDRAVLIDTAGRYTTHESDRSADRQAWGVFLELLRRSRPRRPLNGVLVALPVADLLELSSEGLIAHARLMRSRLDELQLALRVRLPVYLLLTKCDLLPGFVDWFGALERKEREQAWGITFELRASDSAQAAAQLAGEFEHLVDRLADALAARLAQERDAQRRARIFTLPRQLRSLGEPLDLLIRRAFGPGRAAAGAAAPCLRGVYLTSATQHGTPIDRMLSAFGRELGLERQILPPNQSSGKSYFLTRLLGEQVLGEAELSGRSPLRQQARRRARLTAIVALQLAGVALATWWIGSYLGTAQELARLDSEVARARVVVDAMPTRSGPDPRALLPGLDATGALARAVLGTDWAGLADIGGRAREKVRAAAREAYDRMLLGPFQRRIARAIDASLRSGANVNLQYEALKAYTMLREPQHFDGNGFRLFVLSYWNSALLPPLSSAEQVALAGHLEALIRAGAVGSAIAIEPDLIDSVRSRLAAQPPGERIALRLGVLLDSRRHSDFTVARFGTDAAALFVGADGRSPPQAVRGRYTLEAYRDLIMKEAPQIASELAAEADWVLETAPAASSVSTEVFLADYRSRYARAWADLLDDVRVKAPADNVEAASAARSLGAIDGPLVQLLDAIVRQTSPEPEGGEGPIAPDDPLAARFLALRRLLAPDMSGGTPLERTLQSFRRIATQRAAGSAAGPAELSSVLAAAAREPEPVRSMLAALATVPASAPAAVAAAAVPSSPAALSRQIASRLGMDCLRVVPGHFPFIRSAPRDASLEDFSRLFAPRGAFDQVFGQLLAPHLDTSSDDWRPRGTGVAADPEEIERFHSAARIREVFFAHGGSEPGLELTFRPLEMDPEIERFQLEVDGQLIRYAHEPPVAMGLHWPGAHGSARVDITPAMEGEPPLEFSGPWALFRLLDHAAVQDGASPGTLRMVFNVGGPRATFEVKVDSGANPFRLRELEQFSCPLPSP
ncbi:MAG TPA: type VI secretion system membrane subunit TssM [Steroidobacteraceae bacterium]|nr:type VI secretion system membrane subunit TssM [Steroidobacteraceae bacterium]